MRAVAPILAIAALALAGCSSTPTIQAPAAAAATSAPVTAAAASLPPAPPLGSWVVKGSDFQQTLDLRLRTKLIKIGVPPRLATDDAARDLAYMICSMKRTNSDADAVQAAVAQAYPTSDQYSRLSIILTATSYCVDTV